MNDLVIATSTTSAWSAPGRPAAGLRWIAHLRRFRDPFKFMQIRESDHNVAAARRSDCSSSCLRKSVTSRQSGCPAMQSHAVARLEKPLPPAASLTFTSSKPVSPLIVRLQKAGSRGSIVVKATKPAKPVFSAA